MSKILDLQKVEYGASRMPPPGPDSTYCPTIPPVPSSYSIILCSSISLGCS